MSAPGDAAGAAFARGLALHREGQLERASEAYREALEHDAAHTEALHMRGVVALQAGDAAVAAAHIESAIATGRETTQQHNNLGEAYRAAGRADAAVHAFRRALELNSGNLGARANLGLALEAAGAADDAIECLRQVLAKAEDPQTRWNLAGVLERTGQLAQALAEYQRVNAIEPGFEPARMRAAEMLLGLGRAAEARDAFAAIAARHPGEVAPVLGEARALYRLRRFEEAAQRARTATRSAPQDHAAHVLLGLALFEIGELDEASHAMLAPTRRLHARDAPVDTDHLWRTQVTHTKLRHDLEQYVHLDEAGLLDPRDAPAIAAFGEALDALPDEPGAGPHHRVTADSALAPWYNRIVNDWRAPAIGGGALAGDLDPGRTEHAFGEGGPGFAIVDGLLCPGALASLQRYCMESSVWLESKFRDEVGASLRGGFTCPLLLQIAAEVRQTFPTLFAGLPLADVFAYKYYQCDGDGHLHADIGKASINFWITPDESNLDRASGGLLIWNKRVPSEYFGSTPARKDAIERQLVASADARCEHIAYGCNRAMLFHSNVLHKSDHMHFRDRYAERRVSVTMVFGQP